MRYTFKNKMNTWGRKNFNNEPLRKIDDITGEMYDLDIKDKNNDDEKKIVVRSVKVREKKMLLPRMHVSRKLLQLMAQYEFIDEYHVEKHFEDAKINIPLKYDDDLSVSFIETDTDVLYRINLESSVLNLEILDSVMHERGLGESSQKYKVSVEYPAICVSSSIKKPFDDILLVKDLQRLITCLKRYRKNAPEASGSEMTISTDSFCAGIKDILAELNNYDMRVIQGMNPFEEIITISADIDDSEGCFVEYENYCIDINATVRKSFTDVTAGGLCSNLNVIRDKLSGYIIIESEVSKNRIYKALKAHMEEHLDYTSEIIYENKEKPLMIRFHYLTDMTEKQLEDIKNDIRIKFDITSKEAEAFFSENSFKETKTGQIMLPEDSESHGDDGDDDNKSDKTADKDEKLNKSDIIENQEESGDESYIGSDESHTGKSDELPGGSGSDEPDSSAELEETEITPENTVMSAESVIDFKNEVISGSEAQIFVENSDELYEKTILQSMYVEEDIPLEDAGFNVKTYHILKRNGLNTINGMLEYFMKYGIDSLKGLTEKSEQELKIYMESAYKSCGPA